MVDKKKSFLRVFGTGIFVGMTSSYQAFKKVYAKIQRDKLDYTVSRDEVRREFKEYGEDNTRKARIRNIRTRDYISEEWMKQKPLYTGKRYHTIVKMKKFDVSLQKEIDDFVTITHDSLMSKSEIINKARRVIKNAYDIRYGDVTTFYSWEIEDMFENENWGVEN
jgi:hypothetical protein|tara:strand:- start:141 stop:635 length:495 start_codon:yes stop_codon:yes gene_type:complete